MKAEFATALAQARAEFPVIPRSRTVTVRTKQGGTYTFAYAPLEAILAKVVPALSKHGIALTQDLFVTENGARSVLTCLHHGDETVNLAPIPIFISQGASPQEVGSALTYAQRYSLKVALCLSTDDDDDGNLASGNTITSQHPESPAEHVKATAMRKIKSLDELQHFWRSLTADERRALAGVKDEVKATIEVKRELGNEQPDDHPYGE